MTRNFFLFLIALAALCAARLFVIGSFELSPDEAYYSMWAERLDWAYYSKGPGVALAIRAGMEMFGHTEFGVRFFSPILSFTTSLVVFLFARRLYGEPKAILAVALLNCAPIFNVGSVVMTIDPLSIFFWMSAVAAFWLALEKPGFSVWWPVTGLAIGLGFLCKYTNALLLLSVILVLWVFPRNRPRFLQPGLYVLLAVFSLAAIPPVIWNIGNEWVTAAHIWNRGGLTKDSPWNPFEIFEFVASHLGVYSPILFGLFAWGFVRGFCDWQIHNRARYLMCFAGPIIVMYFALSVKEAGEANWTAPGFATLSIFVAHVIWDRVSRGGVWRWVTGAALALGILMSAAVMNTDGVRSALRALGFAQWDYALDPATRLRGWKSAAEALAQIRREQTERYGEPLFLIANKYGTAAALSFYLPDATVEGPGHPPIYTPETQTIENQYAFWPRYDEFILLKDRRREREETAPETTPGTLPQYSEEQGVNPFSGRSALFVTDDVEPDLSGPKNPDVRDGFKLNRWVADLIIERRGQRLRVFRVFLCEGYKTRDL